MGLLIGRSFVRRFIASRRKSAPLSWAHRLAHSFEEAYNNVGSEFSRNGESVLLNRLALVLALLTGVFPRGPGSATPPA